MARDETETTSPDSVRTDMAPRAWGKAKSAIYLAKYSLVKTKAIPYFRQTLRTQHLPSSQLQALNWNRAKRLVAYAYEKTSYYRRRFDAIGLHPEDLKEPADFVSVPTLSRDDLREH